MRGTSNSRVEKRPGKGAPETPTLVANVIPTGEFAVGVRTTHPQRQWVSLKRTNRRRDTVLTLPLAVWVDLSRSALHSQANRAFMSEPVKYDLSGFIGVR
jgi:hypothetical protein